MDGNNRFGLKSPLSRRELFRRGARVGAGVGALTLADRLALMSEQPVYARGKPVGLEQAGQVLVRTPGGAYEDAWRKAAWEPFSAETGIQIVPISTNAAKVQAMVEAGNVELDVLDAGENVCLVLQQREAIEKLDTARFTRTMLSDVRPVTNYYTGTIAYATVLGYNKEAFPSRAPGNWTEFWNTETYPGARMLEDMAAGAVNLEFALLADGVAMDKLYPIDLERAFKKLGEVRRSITKWWDSGAVSAQMLADKQVVLGSVWNGRIQTLIDAGAPLDISWNEAQRLLQVFAVVTGAPNRDNAYKYIDYCLTPEVQARFCQEIAYGPVNVKAFEYIPAAALTKMPTTPDRIQTSFATDEVWWLDNQRRVADRWQEFLLGG